MVQFSMRMGQSRPIYQGLKALQVSAEWTQLEEGQQRIVEAMIRDAELTGVGL